MCRYPKPILIPLKLYPNLIHAVVESLRLIFAEGQYADKVIERALKSNPKWGARDRAFIAEHVYEIVRWYRLLYEIRGQEPQSEAGWWELFGILLIIRGKDLPDWEEFRRLDTQQARARLLQVGAERRVGESIPDWLDELGEHELGELWPPTLHALNEPAAVVLRTNRLRTTPPELIQRLQEEGVVTQRIGVDALRVIERSNLFRTKAFREGLFEVQDYSSQQVAPLLGVEPGMRVIDACAGAGGKTLHLAALLQNQGQLIALDTEAWKLDELRRRARRAGATNIEARPITGSKVIKRLSDSADRLLIDAPCSGLGVLRRNPDAKWKLSPDFIDRLRETQHQILSSYTRMVKPGGRLVYATCSVLPSENEAQVRRFLDEQPDRYTLLEEKTIRPQDEGYDGFYLALMERKG